MSSLPENAGQDDPGRVVELGALEYSKPYRVVTDFRHLVRPIIDEGADPPELVGIEVWLHHPAWPEVVCYKLGRLYAVELASGILALVDSHDTADHGPTANEGR